MIFGYEDNNLKICVGQATKLYEYLGGDKSLLSEYFTKLEELEEKNPNDDEKNNNLINEDKKSENNEEEDNGEEDAENDDDDESGNNDNEIGY